MSGIDDRPSFTTEQAAMAGPEAVTLAGPLETSRRAGDRAWHHIEQQGAAMRELFDAGCVNYVAWSDSAPAADPLVDFEIMGTPIPQGSKTGFAFRDKSTGNMRVAITEGRGKSTASHKLWRQAVDQAARDWQKDNRIALLDTPLRVSLEFWLDRPKSKPKWKIYPDVKPDADKLSRSVLDSLTSIIIKDDSRVVRMECSKLYALGRPPGARVRIWVVEEGPLPYRVERSAQSEQDEWAGDHDAG